MSRTPDFLIVGAKRSGTSLLFYLLRQHPKVFEGTKELHYFDYGLDRGIDWYLSQFAEAAPDELVGEATQSYMFDPAIAPEMAKVAPNAKLLAILRNPIERAYSDYRFQVARGREDLTFEEALEQEDLRTAESYPRFLQKSYVGRGMYADQLRRLAEFFPLDRIKVLIFEEFTADQRTGYEEVCEFLGLDLGSGPTDFDRTVNPTIEYRSPLLNRVARRFGSGPARAVAKVNRRVVEYRPMAESTRSALVKRFEEPNEHLASWLGRDLGIWR